MPERARGMQILLAGAILSVVTVALFGCAGKKLTYVPQTGPAGIVASDVTWEAPDGRVLVKGVRLTCPGKVLNADLDVPAQSVLIKYEGSENMKKDGKNLYAVYDLGSRSSNWVGVSNATSDFVTDGVATLQITGDCKCIDGQSGELLRPCTPSVVVWDDGVALQLSQDKFARVNERTGEEIWSQSGHSWNGFRLYQRKGDWVYVLADGLAGMNVESGDGWFIPASMYHKAYGKAFAQNMAMSCLAGMGGGYYAGHTDPEVTHNVSADPLEIGDNVYFAARQKVICVNRSTGDKVWTSEIPEEVGSMGLFKAGDYVALVGLGWKFVDFRVKEARKPCLFLFDASSGDLVGHVEIEDASTLNDVVWLDSEIWLLGPKQVHRLSHDLEILGVRDANSTAGDFIRHMTTTDDEVMIRTTMGVLSLDRGTLEESWFRKVAVVVPDNSKLGNYTGWEREALLAMLTSVEEKKRAWRGHGFDWVGGSYGEFAAIDPVKGGEPVISIDVGSGEYGVTYSGYLLAYADNDVTIANLADAQVADVIEDIDDEPFRATEGDEAETEYPVSEESTGEVE